MRELEPVLTGPLFAGIRSELLSLLRTLSEEEWRRPTAAAKWNVKDVALHILGGDVGNLSRRRDGFSLPADLSSYAKLVEFINEINASWVIAGQRMSPPLLMDLLEHVGRQADGYFLGLDPFAMGGPVGWAGQEPVPVWFDVAREYTERWHHQQQIRDATGRPGLYERRWFEPVMDTFVRALPRAFAEVEAAEGTTVTLRVSG
ncbi:MAG TPA: maleylpyruvate isomerase family mycothiol-dependent enzyme, partial [Candidatus Acidoferrum sp.]|nr:maleylpyruvate isomerase family mycothiol-dependent enzyme [Candidatus Acidoferrum sp.]